MNRKILIMKKLVLLLGIVFGLMIVPNENLKASHVSGGDFQYTCLGGDSFLVTLNIYRFCGGASMPTTVNITFNSPCGNQTATVQRDSIKEVSQLCPQEIQNSQCNNGNLPGMQHGFFSTIVVLPPCAAGPWTMSYSLCCRNSTNNLSGQPQYTIDALLDNFNGPCNNSPKFEGQPIPYVCAGSQVNYSFGAIESDGDSVVFTLDQPLSNNITTPAPYQGGYSPTNPFNVPVTLNPNTGQLTFTPVFTAGVPFWVIKVCANEYRNNILVGKVCRDVQFTVQNCNNQIPYMTSNGITNFSGNGVQIDSNTVELCIGNNINFDIEFGDSLLAGQAIGDSVTITTNVGSVMQGANITITNGNPATINIDWTAPPGANNSIVFTVDIQDDACPIPGIGSFAFFVNVIPSTYVGPDIELCEDDTGFLSVVGGSQFTWTVLQGSPIAPGVNFSDTIGTTAANVWVYPNQTMIYRVESNLSSTCDNSDTIQVTLFDKYDADFFLDTPFCVTDIPDTAVPVTTTPAGTWSGPGIIDGQVGAFDPGVAGAGMIPVNYAIQSGQGNCNTDTTIMIEVVPLPDPSVNPPLEFCYTGGPYNLTAVTGGGEWIGASVTDPINGVVDPGVLSAPGSTPIIHELTYPCLSRDTVDILFYQNFEFDLVDTPLILCSTDTAALNEFIRPVSVGPVSPNPAVYTWNGPGVSNADSGWFNAADVPNGLSEFMINVTAADQNGDCQTTKSVRVIIEEPETPSVTGPLSFCSDIEQAAILTDPPMKLGNWEINPIAPTMAQLSFDANRPGRLNPENAGSGEWEFTFTFTDLNGCVGTLTDTIRILDTPEPPELEEYNFCVGDLMDLEASFTNHPDSLIWYDADSNLNQTEELGTGSPYFHGVASESDEGTSLFVTEKNGVCESAPTRFDIPIRPRPNADFTISFTDSMDVDQEVTASSYTGKLNLGPGPVEVEFEAVERGEEDMTMDWDLWLGCNPIDGVAAQPCPLTAQGYTAETTYEKESDVYSVRYIKRNNFGCLDTVSIDFEVGAAVNIPNIFTPNGDGNNDVFYIPGATVFSDFNLTIYNRWGRKVAEITDASKDAGWDGGDAPAGTYFFIATATRGSGEEFLEKGHVTLLREK